MKAESKDVDEKSTRDSLLYGESRNNLSITSQLFAPADTIKEI